MLGMGCRGSFARCAADEIVPVDIADFLFADAGIPLPVFRSGCGAFLLEGLATRLTYNDARLLFEKMLGYANHLGLYGEELGLAGETLGNFPQAFTHLGLISAAYNLNQELDRRRGRSGMRTT